MVSRKTAWVVGLTGIVITAVCCGVAIRNVWKSIPGYEERTSRIPFVSGEEEEFILEKQGLIIDKDPEIYTYENMEHDFICLAEKYPDQVSCITLAETTDRRNVYCLVIGDSQAEKSILVSGGIHGREYISCQLVMKQAVSFLRHLEAGDHYGTCTYEQLLENTNVYCIPMINPDGVSISQKGMDGIQTESVKEQIRIIAEMDGQQPEGRYLELWKANANGVDLNRNFPALWEEYQEPVEHPSADHYKGTAPGSEAESAALIRLTEEKHFLRTVSYHAQGSEIYWYFGQQGELYEENLKFGQMISRLTGYSMDADISGLDPAGYKDWAVSVMGIPSLTIEIGRDITPVPMEQWEEIWLRNAFVWEEILCDLSSKP
ncbi:MAG: M14 family zinc carboxypeptidase [Oliverpabstia sp.]